MLHRFFSEEEGATMVEYGIMVALVAAVSIFIIGQVGQKVLAAFTTVNNCMEDPGTPC